MKRLVIVGGGFAGVWAALAAARMRRASGAELAITVVSRDPWLTIRPRLYESTLDDVRVPLDQVLGPAGVERVEGEVARIDPAAHTIAVRDAAGTRVLAYERLVLAAGSRMFRPPIPGIEHAFAVDSYAEATALQRHLESLGSAPPARRDAATFTAVVVGAGFTGIEVVTALAARLRDVAARAGARSRVVLVGRSPAVAPDLGADARGHVTVALAKLGVEVRAGVAVSALAPGEATLDGGERIAAATVVWTGGFRASALSTQLPAERDEAGRLMVDEWLRVRGVDDVYAAGDIAHAIADERGGARPAPMSCQCAIPMGETAGANAAADLLALPATRFAYPYYVTCLDLGEAGGLFMQGWERKVTLAGYWGKVMKEAITTRLIYPPRGDAVSLDGDALAA